MHFGPYGFRATWHHLMVSAGVPQRLEDDPAALDRAVDELEEARMLWATYRDAFAERRRQEKARGRRTPRRSERWYSWDGRIAYCPDAVQHPRGRLAAVVQRVMDTYSTGADWSAMCQACGCDRSDAELCSHCGVAPPDAITLPSTSAQRSPGQWRHIWRRTAYVESLGRQPCTGTDPGGFKRSAETKAGLKDVEGVLMHPGCVPVPRGAERRTERPGEAYSS